jgi:hypothetical protein
LTATLTLLAGFALLLLILLGWVLRDPRKLAEPEADLSPTEEVGQRHVTYFPQVRQSMAAEDYTFLASRGSSKLTRRVRKERRRIALAYLFCLRNDFLKLWRLARVIASLSPQVGLAQEFARLRLGLTFALRFQMIRIRFLFGFAPVPELGHLSEVVSRLALRLETAMNELGERAVLTAKLASSLNGRGLDTP